MNCPKCDSELRRGKVKGTTVEIDQCEGCSGLWFDDGELPALLGAAAGERVAIPPHARASTSSQCPRCNVPLAWFTYPGTARVVDACRTCSGVWLDAGEGKALRAALSGAADQMTCPKCGAAQPRAQSCAQCGIIITRYRDRSSEPHPANVAAQAPEPEIPGVKGKLLRFIDNSISYFLG